MEPIIVHDSDNCGVRDHKIKGDKPARGLSMGNGPRKRLADISNLPQECKPVNQLENVKSSSLTTNQYIEQLRKENITLMKALADKNKIIELSAIELQKLRLTAHKLQQQNIQLAQANSQTTVELNSGKDKQKALHHELGCKNALLHAIKLELEEKTNLIMSQIAGKESKVEFKECSEAVKSSQENNGDSESNTTNRRRQSRKTSFDPNSSKPVESKEKTDNDRHSLRRSKRFIAEDQKLPEALSEEPELVSGPTTAKPLKAKDNKRLCLRRQSARLESDEPETTEPLPVRDDAKIVEPEKNAEDKRLCAARLEADEMEPTEPLPERVDSKPNELMKKADNKRLSLRRQSMCFKSGESEPIEAMSEDPRPVLGISSTIHAKQHKATLNKRHSTKKRQSEKVKSEECEPSKDVFQIDNVKFPVAALDHKSVLKSSMKIEDDERNNICCDEAREFTRLSTGRPSRLAAVKVQSYKEVPLNVKMRRSE